MMTVTYNVSLMHGAKYSANMLSLIFSDSNGRQLLFMSPSIGTASAGVFNGNHRVYSGWSIVHSSAAPSGMSRTPISTLGPRDSPITERRSDLLVSNGDICILISHCRVPPALVGLKISATSSKSCTASWGVLPRL